MKAQRFALLGGATAASAMACSLAVDLGGYSGGAAVPVEGGLQAVPDASPDAAPDASSITGTSCRAIHASAPDAGTGVYGLRVDGGVTQAYCDMESFGGGWTLVTPAMVVEDKAIQDIAPSSPAKVTVTRSTDANGGFTFSVSVDNVNCGADNTQPGPEHHVLFAELDGFTQVMATYRFFGASDCWDLFGASSAPPVNVRPFDPQLDLIDRQQNMARDDAGAPLPYDGRNQWCNISPSNFWDARYVGDVRTARVVLRRSDIAKAAGLGVGVDCGDKTRWDVSAIYVR